MSRRHFQYFLAIVASNSLLGNVTGLFLPIYFQQIGLSGFQSGVYFAFSYGAAILLALPVGISTDRLSIVKILALGLVLGALNRLGFLLTSTFAWFCLFALLGSFGARLFGTSIQALFFKLNGGEGENSQKAGWYMLANFVGGGVGMLVGGWLIQQYDFRTGFAIGAAGNLALIAMTFLLPRNETVVIRLDEYKKAVLQPNVLLLTTIFFLSSLHWGAEATSYTPFLKYNLHLSMVGVSLYAGFGLFFVGGGTYLGTILIERRVIKDLPALLSVGFLLSGVFHVLMCVPSLWASFTFRCLHEIGDGFVFLVYYQGIAKVFKLDKIGGCAAFVSLWTAIGSLLGSLVFGWLGGKYGHQWPLIVSGVILACVPLLLRFEKAGLDGQYGRA